MFLFYLVIGALQMFFDDDDDDRAHEKSIFFLDIYWLLAAGISLENIC